MLLDNDIVVQFDEDGKIIGLEIWDMSKRGLKEIVKNVGARLDRRTLRTL